MMSTGLSGAVTDSPCYIGHQEIPERHWDDGSTIVGESIDSAQLIGRYNHFCTELKMSQLVYGCTGRTPTMA
jgi:hypothetical protein